MFSSMNFWMCAAALVFSVAGVITFRKDIAAARGWDRLIVWASIFASLYFAITRYRAGTIAIWIGVVSHWIFDWTTHRPDLPLYPGGPRFGLGLWNSVAGTMTVEFLLLSIGLWMYVGTTRARDRIGRYGFLSYVIVLLLIYIAAGVVGATGLSWLATRLGKHRTLMIASTGYSLGLVCMLLLPQGVFGTAAALMFSLGFLAAGFPLLDRAMVADVGDAQLGQRVHAEGEVRPGPIVRQVVGGADGLRAEPGPRPMRGAAVEGRADEHDIQPVQRVRFSPRHAEEGDIGPVHTAHRNLGVAVHTVHDTGARP